MNDAAATTEGQLPVPNSNIFLFFGIALTILGVIAIGSQFLFTIGTVMFFGALMLVAGVAELIHTVVSKQRKKLVFNILSSLAYIVTGCLTLNNPLIGALGLTLVMGAFFLVAGAVRIGFAFAHKEEPQWAWFLMGGIINLILGLMIITGWPATGLWMIGLFVGIEMIFHGTAWIMLAFVMKGAKKQPA